MNVRCDLTEELYQAIENLVDYILQWDGLEFGEVSSPNRREAEIIAAQFINNRCFNPPYESDKEAIASALAQLRTEPEEEEDTKIYGFSLLPTLEDEERAKVNGANVFLTLSGLPETED